MIYQDHCLQKSQTMHLRPHGRKADCLNHEPMKQPQQWLRNQTTNTLSPIRDDAEVLSLLLFFPMSAPHWILQDYVLTVYEQSHVPAKDEPGFYPAVF